MKLKIIFRIEPVFLSKLTIKETTNLIVRTLKETAIRILRSNSIL